MWRGPVVAWRKSESAVKRQKVFSIHTKLITIAARWGWDPDFNPALADAIWAAKKDNVPNDNIKRAIDKWIWADKSWDNLEQITYEWYGASGVAVIITTLTDNKNRTASSVRHIFSKYWWNMWEPGSVWFIFERSGVVIIDLSKYDNGELEELVYETSAGDFFIEDGLFKITTSLEDFTRTKKFFEDKNIDMVFADLDFIPSNIIDIEEFDDALKLTKMIEDFEDDEDVQKISTNMNISQDMQKQVDDFIASHRFNT